MPRALAALTFLSSLALCAGPVHPREGGVLVEFCPPTGECLGDSLEIVFASGASTYEGPLEVGTAVPIEVVVETETPGIQGFSYGVRHDPRRLELLAETVTTEGTIIDPGDPRTVMSPPYFETTRPVPGGFISGVVFSFTEDRTLPVGERLTIARALYSVVSPPGCTLLEFAHRELAVNPGAPPVEIVFTIAGRNAAPRLVHGLIDAGPCPELCGDGADNDGDGALDCDDEECAGRGVCARAEECGDGVDNDVDGTADCADPDCRSEPPCREACDNGADDDGDGLADCDDPQCSSQPPCGEVCDNGGDDDGDGLADCDDPQCWSHTACREPEECNDGIDNDRDQRVDCGDPDCSQLRFCDPVPGPDGGVLEDFSEEDPECAGNSLEVVFATDSSTLRAATPPGSEIPITIIAETRSPGVSSWSYGVRHDPEVLHLDPESVTTAGTVVEPEPEGVAVPPYFDVTESVPGGFVSAVVLSFIAETQLPLKRNRIARAVYIVRSDPSGQRLELVGPSFLAGGESRWPCRLRHGWIPGVADPLWENCADGVDNDRDGLADCADRDCLGFPACCEVCAPAPGPLPAPFRRGDADGDGRVTVRDAVVVILASLQIRAAPYECNGALDADGDGRLATADALPILAWVFQRGESLVPPFFTCGYGRDCREASPACH